MNNNKINDEELSNIAGGTADTRKTIMAFCPQCNQDTEHTPFSGGRIKCLKCGKVHEEVYGTV